LFDVGVVVCGVFSRGGLQTVKFVLPNRGCTRPLGVRGLYRWGISESEDETTGRGRTIVVISRRDLDGIASHP